MCVIFLPDGKSSGEEENRFCSFGISGYEGGPEDNEGQGWYHQQGHCLSSHTELDVL